MKNILICLVFFGFLVIFIAGPSASMSQTTTTIIDPVWQRTSNYVLADAGLSNYYDEDLNTWTWTENVWNGSLSELLYYEYVSPTLPPDYIYHDDQWFYTLDHGAGCNNPATHYWFRTNLYIDSMSTITSIRIFDKYSQDFPHIAVNDRIYVFVNGVYTDEVRGSGIGAAYIDWNLAPTTGWVADAIEIPLIYFSQGTNEVAILYEESCYKGGLGHLVFEISEIVQTAITATIDIHPDTLNLKSKGKWMTCYIELSDEYISSVNDIDVDTLVLTIDGCNTDDCSIQRANESPTEVGNYDNDEVLDLMIKFDRGAIQNMVTPGTAEITVSGFLTDGTEFQGTDIVLVIEKGNEHIDEENPGSVEF